MPRGGRPRRTSRGKPAPRAPAKRSFDSTSTPPTHVLTVEDDDVSGSAIIDSVLKDLESESEAQASASAASSSFSSPPIMTPEQLAHAERVVNERAPEQEEENNNNESDMEYYEDVVSAFAGQLENVVTSVQRIEDLCLAISNDWERCGLWETLQCIGYKGKRGEFANSDLYPLSTIRQHFVWETLSTMAQLLSISILQLLQHIIFLPLKLVISMRDDETAWSQDSQRYVIPEHLWKDSINWRSYLNAIVDYDTNVVTPRNAHANLLKLAPSQVVWSPQVLREFAERQAKIFPREIKHLGNLKSRDPSIKHLHRLLECCSAVMNEYEDLFILTGFTALLFPEAENPRTYATDLLKDMMHVLDLPTEHIVPLKNRPNNVSSSSGSAGLWKVPFAIRNVIIMSDYEQVIPGVSEQQNYSAFMETSLPMMLFELDQLSHLSGSGGDGEDGEQDDGTATTAATMEFENPSELSNYLLTSEAALSHLMNGGLSQDQTLRAIVDTLLPTKEQRDALTMTPKMVQRVFFGLAPDQDIGSQAARLMFNGGRGLRPSLQYKLAQELSEACGVPSKTLKKFGRYVGRPSEATAVHWLSGGSVNPLGNMGSTYNLARELNMLPIDAETGKAITNPNQARAWWEKVEQQKRDFQVAHDKLSQYMSRLITDFQSHEKYPEWSRSLLNYMLSQSQRPVNNFMEPINVNNLWAAGDESKVAPEMQATFNEIGEFVKHHPEHKAFELLLEVGEKDETLATELLNTDEAVALARRFRLSSIHLDAFISFADSRIRDRLQERGSFSSPQEQAVYEELVSPETNTELSSPEASVNPENPTPRVITGMESPRPSSSTLVGFNETERIPEPIDLLDAESYYTYHQHLLPPNPGSQPDGNVLLRETREAIEALLEYARGLMKQSANTNYLKPLEKSEWLPFGFPLVEKDDKDFLPLVDKAELLLKPFLLPSTPSNQPSLEIHSGKLADLFDLINSLADAKFPLILDGLSETARVTKGPKEVVENDDARKFYCWIISEVLYLVINYYVWLLIDIDAIAVVIKYHDNFAQEFATIPLTNFDEGPTQQSRRFYVKVISKYLNELHKTGFTYGVLGQNTTDLIQQDSEQLTKLLKALESIDKIAEEQHFAWGSNGTLSSVVNKRFFHVINTTEGRSRVALYFQMLHFLYDNALPYITWAGGEIAGLASEKFTQGYDLLKRFYSGTKTQAENLATNVPAAVTQTSSQIYQTVADYITQKGVELLKINPASPAVQERVNGIEVPDRSLGRVDQWAVNRMRSNDTTALEMFPDISVLRRWFAILGNKVVVDVNLNTYVHDIYQIIVDLRKRLGTEGAEPLVQKILEKLNNIRSVPQTTGASASTSTENATQPEKVQQTFIDSFRDAAAIGWGIEDQLDRHPEQVTIILQENMPQSVALQTTDQPVTTLPTPSSNSMTTPTPTPDQTKVSTSLVIALSEAQSGGITGFAQVGSAWHRTHGIDQSQTKRGFELARFVLTSGPLLDIPEHTSALLSLFENSTKGSLVETPVWLLRMLASGANGAVTYTRMTLALKPALLPAIRAIPSGFRWLGGQAKKLVTKAEPKKGQNPQSLITKPLNLVTKIKDFDEKRETVLKNLVDGETRTRLLLRARPMLYQGNTILNNSLKTAAESLIPSLVSLLMGGIWLIIGRPRVTDLTTLLQGVYFGAAILVIFVVYYRDLQDWYFYRRTITRKAVQQIDEWCNTEALHSAEIEGLIRQRIRGV